MVIKSALLEDEFTRIKEFLSSFDLKLDKDVTKTFYIEEDDKIIGTISCSDYIIKDLAVNPNYQSENLAGKLVTEMISYFASNGIFSYQVFTKPMYSMIFTSLGFRKLCETDKVIMLEGGTAKIDEELEKIKNQVEHTLAPLDEKTDVAALVINGNPLTIGHVHLIETAHLLHNIVIVFIVEENRSEFSFEERLSMAYLATRRMMNVCVVPSTKYAVSNLTFPTYFLKSDDEVNKQNALVDALIFKNYFMKKFFIKKRYVGEEVSPKMVNYNNTLKEVLGDDLEIIPRLKKDETVVSASTVRKLCKEGKISEALKYIPVENQCIFKLAAMNKYGKR